VHHLNIVDAGELRLIDWEYAGIGEPMFDLASVCVYQRYDERRRHQLLSAYPGGSEAAAYQRLEMACWLFEYVRELWLAVRELTGDTTPGDGRPSPIGRP
jgi:thiamine kinase-like enzyme